MDEFPSIEREIHSGDYTQLCDDQALDHRVSTCDEHQIASRKQRRINKAERQSLIRRIRLARAPRSLR